MRGVAASDARRRVAETSPASRTARPHRTRSHVATDLPLLVLLLVFTLPIVWMVLLSIQPDRVIITPSWNFDFTLNNIAALWAPDQPYATQMLNSVIIVLGTVALCGSIAAVTGLRARQAAHQPLAHDPRAGVLRRAAADAADGTGPRPLCHPRSDRSCSARIPGLILVNTVLNLPFATLLMKLASMRCRLRCGKPPSSTAPAKRGSCYRSCCRW